MHRSLKYSRIALPLLQCECILIHLYNPFPCDIINIYRSPSICYEKLLADLSTIISYCLSDSIIVVGDFNIDIFKTNISLLSDPHLSFTQIITTPTTPQGSLLDHIYVKGVSILKVVFILNFSVIIFQHI